MSTTPVRTKRAVQTLRGTPMPLKKKRRTSQIVGVYNPPVFRLRKHYDAEFTRFLTSLRTILDHIEREIFTAPLHAKYVKKKWFIGAHLHHLVTRHETLIPTRRQLRRNHKDSSALHLYFKSLAYWKSFYSSYLEHVDTMMDCFRFDDLRSIDDVVDAHQLPDELVSFVTQQLMEWRELFKDVQWMKTYRSLSEQIAEHHRKRQEQAERDELLREIGLEIEMSHLDIGKFEELSEQPEKLGRAIIAQVKAAKRSNEIAEQLKNMPTLSKRCNTREWCRKHYESPSLSTSSSASDDESSSSDANSSMLGDAGNSSAADLSSSSEGDIDSFFCARGL